MSKLGHTISEVKKNHAADEGGDECPDQGRLCPKRHGSSVDCREQQNDRDQGGHRIEKRLPRAKITDDPSEKQSLKNDTCSSVSTDNVTDFGRVEVEPADFYRHREK